VLLDQPVGQCVERQLFLATQLPNAQTQVDGDALLVELLDIAMVQHPVGAPGVGLRRQPRRRFECFDGILKHPTQRGDTGWPVQPKHRQQRASAQLDGIVEVVQRPAQGADERSAAWVLGRIVDLVETHTSTRCRLDGLSGPITKGRFSKLSGDMAG